MQNLPLTSSGLPPRKRQGDSFRRAKEDASARLALVSQSVIAPVHLPAGEGLAHQAQSDNGGACPVGEESPSQCTPRLPMLLSRNAPPLRQTLQVHQLRRDSHSPHRKR